MMLLWKVVTQPIEQVGLGLRLVKRAYIEHIGNYWEGKSG